MTKRLKGSSVELRIQWPVNLSWRSRIVLRRDAWPVRWYRLSFFTWSRDCLISRIIHVLAKMSSLSINASVSILVSQPYSNIEIHDALNRWVLKSNSTFGDLTLIVLWKWMFYLIVLCSIYPHCNDWQCSSFWVFDEESNITQRLSELFCGIFFSDKEYFLDKAFEPLISRSVYEHVTTSLSRRFYENLCKFNAKKKDYSLSISEGCQDKHWNMWGIEPALYCPVNINYHITYCTLSSYIDCRIILAYIIFK